MSWMVIVLGSGSCDGTSEDRTTIPFEDATYPVDSEEVLIGAQDAFGVAPAVDEVLGSRGRNLALAPQELIQVLALRVGENYLHLIGGSRQIQQVTHWCNTPA